ncbi:MAG: phospholipase D-like domain-containing protein [Bdellovibrionia bacterium]
MMREMAAIETWSSERVFHSGQEYFDALEKDLASAQKSVDLETYIFDDDALGQRVCEQLKSLAARGVIVRIMVDGVGSPAFYGRFGAELTQAGAHVRIFNPSPLDLTLFSFRFFPGLSRIIQFFWSSNRRNHRKTVMIDRKSAWTGGINVSAKQASRYTGEKAWRDTGIRVEGPEISELQRAFEVAWSHAWSPIPQRRGLNYFWQRYRRARIPVPTGLVQVNYTRRLRRRTNFELVRNIYAAKKRIWITTAYFIPEASIMRAMRGAAKRGIDVRIIVPVHSDVFFTPWVGAAFYHTLLKAGVKIFEYQPCMLHAKTILVDTWGWVGSANLNHRSVFHDLEVNLAVTSSAGIDSLSNQFLIDQEESRLVKPSDWKERSIFTRMIGNILLFLKYWF